VRLVLEIHKPCTAKGNPAPWLFQRCWQSVCFAAEARTLGFLQKKVLFKSLGEQLLQAIQQFESLFVALRGWRAGRLCGRRGGALLAALSALQQSLAKVKK
jgi:hypothetical protein